MELRKMTLHEFGEFSKHFHGELLAKFDCKNGSVMVSILNLKVEENHIDKRVVVR